MQHNWKAGVPTTQIASARRDLQNVLLDPCLKPPKSALGTARTAPSRFSHSRTRPRALLAPGLARGGTTDSQFLSVRVPLVSSCASCHHILSGLGSGSCLLKFSIRAAVGFNFSTQETARRGGIMQLPVRPGWKIIGIASTSRGLHFVL